VAACVAACVAAYSKIAPEILQSSMRVVRSLLVARQEVIGASKRFLSFG